MSKYTLNEIFVKRLNSVMSTSDIPESLANRARYLQGLTGMTIQACRKWVKGECLPEYETMMKIASQFRVTTSYLIGETDNKNFSSYDDKFVLKNSVKTGVITVDITEDMFDGLLKAGDTVICEPTSSTVENGEIYLLQSANRKHFCILDRDENTLSVKSSSQGQEKIVTYEDPTIIDLFLASMVGKVKAVIREVTPK